MSSTGRRGLMAAAVALAVAAVSKITALSARAADGSPLLIGQGNAATSSTALSRSNSGAAGSAFVVSNDNGPAIQGESRSSSSGVVGTSAAAPGVRGESTSGQGVLATSGTGWGAWGYSDSGYGVVGSSASGNGMYAQGAVGLWAYSANGVGVYGVSGSGQAGWFDGPVIVNGSLSVTGIKSAAVPHPDGTYRRLYCLESPESYFEDFGRGQLVNGVTNVNLDGEFAAIVHGEDYDVFLTPYGDSDGLYVASRSPVGFEVREVKGGGSQIAFAYRVVARRKDIAGVRLELVDVVPCSRQMHPPEAVDPSPAPREDDRSPISAR